ncbi:MAG: nicotinate phosphoribosyltransferase [Planctomycetes bacterium]|nr:nicotinate phosphoribosyltransferase [Planctomycetota bacterium]
MTQSLFPDDMHLGLVTDLYELTMAAGYFVHGLGNQRATFELWVRRLPACRNYLIAAGLEQAVHYLQHLSFAPEQIEYLRQHPVFRDVPAGWFEHLADFRFTGDVWAIPEGTAVFAGEPLLRITAPIEQAQVAETYLIASLTMQTMIASKAARVRAMAQGRAVFDFGSRRAHGPQAGLLAARASFLGGCCGTSNTEAGRLLGIPALGTQAHAWIMAWGDECEAFRRFAALFPHAATLLIDTFDTVQGVRNALASGAAMQAVRLDSGDLLTLSREVRAILDAAGRSDVRIVASGDLNEYKIRDLMEQQAPIDSFGVGTELVTSRDDPTLSMVYKLVEQETPAGRVGRFKLATAKKSYPYAKQVFRQTDDSGLFREDVIAHAEEALTGQPLLIPVMRAGRTLGPLPALAEVRARCLDQIPRLPGELHALAPAAEPFPVRYSARLESEAERLANQWRANPSGRHA